MRTSEDTDAHDNIHPESYVLGSVGSLAACSVRKTVERYAPAKY